MKKIIVIIGIISLSYSCKQNTETKIVESEISVAEKIANAYGFENWKNVNEIQFTFNVDKDSSHFGRHWTWKPKTNDVIMMTATDTITYNRKSIDSLSMRADQGFINDKFWLLIPFQLVWDEGTTITEPIKIEAPISKIEMNKITLTYSNDGGYTPGDAYDLFYTDDFSIKEWIFRKGNSEEPSLINTFENHQEFNGIKIALEHKKQGENWNLNFTDIKVILE